MTDLKKTLPGLLIPRLWPASRPDLRRRVVIALLFLLLAKLVNVAVPYFFKRAVDLLDTGVSAAQIAVGAVLAMVLAYGVARMAAQGFGELRDAVFAKVAQAAIRDLALQTFNHLHALSLRFHLERQTGGLSRVIERGTKGIQFVLQFMTLDSDDRPGDYAISYARLAALCGFAVVNVSSPNTPGLRNLQGREELAAMLARLQPLHAQYKTPLLVKIAPDLAEEDIDAVAELALQYELDGIVATNPTIARPDSLRSHHKAETGGLSGAPLRARAQAVLKQLYGKIGTRMPLIGVGGIASGEDAYARIRAGASAVQLYSAMVFEGPGLVSRIKGELAALLKRDGFKSVAEAVGKDS